MYLCDSHVSFYSGCQDISNQKVNQQHGKWFGDFDHGELDRDVLNLGDLGIDLDIDIDDIGLDLGDVGLDDLDLDLLP